MAEDLETLIDTLNQHLDEAAPRLAPLLASNLDLVVAKIAAEAKALLAQRAADDGSFWDDEIDVFSAKDAAEVLCDWARGEAPERVEQLTKAIRGGARVGPLPDLLRGVPG